MGPLTPVILAMEVYGTPRSRKRRILSARPSRPDGFVRCVGDSLDKVGLRPGDVLAVRANHGPRDGDIVVARIGDEVVVQRFCRTGPDGIELQSESHNREHDAIRITLYTIDFEIVGTRRQNND